MIPVAKLTHTALVDAGCALKEKFGARVSVRASNTFGFALHVRDRHGDLVGIVVDVATLRNVRRVLEKREAYCSPEVSR